jgi:MYXO-CTERM domain-containing protein
VKAGISSLPVHARAARSEQPGCLINAAASPTVPRGCACRTTRGEGDAIGLSAIALLALAALRRSSR